MITEDLFIDFNTKIINEEFLYYLNTPGKLGNISYKNNIIKYFQQFTFYKKELELWKNQKIKNKIIHNRCKYLNKNINELTNIDILQGFKRTGIYYGYSHFNPLWFKWFINNYNIKTCYDPCGGWGHRLLGSLDLNLYIYNDLSTSIKNNVDNIINYFNMFHVKTYNNDCKNFIPIEKFESIFTCPPYFNLEHYECGDFKNIEEYNKFLKSLFNIFYSLDFCNIFGLVIREDLLNKTLYKPTEEYDLNIHKSMHITKGKNVEKLYIFKK